MSLIGEAAVEIRATDLPSRAASPATWAEHIAPDGLRKADSMKSAGIAGQPVSSGDAPPKAKRARRDAVTRVWEWLDVSVSREASLTLGGADFGHMHLSEGSSVTTAVTAAPPCDAVEPCALGEASEGLLLQAGSLGTTAKIDRSLLRSASAAQGPDEASSRPQDTAGSPAEITLEARGSSTPVIPDCGPRQLPTEEAPPADAVPVAESAPAGAEGTGADARRVTRQNSRKRKHDRGDGDGGSCGVAFYAAVPAGPDQAAEGQEAIAAETPGKS